MNNHVVIAWVRKQSVSPTLRGWSIAPRVPLLACSQLSQSSLRSSPFPATFVRSVVLASVPECRSRASEMLSALLFRLVSH